MTTTFEIKTYDDYFKRLLLEQYKEFMTEENYNSSRHAIICAMLAYHLREWIWNDDPNSVKICLLKLHIINKNQEDNNDYVQCKYNEYVNNKCPEFKLIRKICNGAKHFTLNDSNIETYKRKGSFNGAFDGNSFPTDDLMVDDENGNSIVFKNKLQIDIAFWKKFIKEIQNIN